MVIHTNNARATLQVLRCKNHDAAAMTADDQRCVPDFPPPPASDFSRMPESVAVGVIASGSIFKCMIDGWPDFCAAANAAGKSAVFSTSTPKPPKALA